MSGSVWLHEGQTQTCVPLSPCCTHTPHCVRVRAYGIAKHEHRKVTLRHLANEWYTMQSVVRYFQAWIEGGRTEAFRWGAGGEESSSDASSESSNDSQNSDLLEDSVFVADFVDKVNERYNIGSAKKNSRNLSSENPTTSSSKDSEESPSEGGCGEGGIGSASSDSADGGMASEEMSVAEKTVGLESATIQRAGMVGVGSLTFAKPAAAKKKVVASIHDELMQEQSVRKLGDQPMVCV
jgi:hypothetical protein